MVSCNSIYIRINNVLCSCKLYYEVHILDQSIAGGGFLNTSNQFGGSNTPGTAQKSVCKIKINNAG